MGCCHPEVQNKHSLNLKRSKELFTINTDTDINLDDSSHRKFEDKNTNSNSHNSIA